MIDLKEQMKTASALLEQATYESGMAGGENGLSRLLNDGGNSIADLVEEISRLRKVHQAEQRRCSERLEEAIARADKFEAWYCEESSERADVA